ncbi:hypothetical protein INT45_012864 [Circinella minor]|uniref:Uncharacterized protein n=1 Tax=Circinella minor TaxID=1195481 RepID=A0A8H7S9X9_9FUNG|nr:hypothetical protein INT45_012864 [Circinella minor]
MADDSSVTIIRTFDRHCFDEVCHCDWRITLQNCEEHHAMYIINVINIIVSALGCIIGIGLLIYRVGMKGHRIWSPAGTVTGIIRPKPVDCSMVLFAVFNALRFITSLILITDVDPGNLLGRSVLYEVPWSIGLGGITVYLLGVSQAIAQSHSTLGWLPSPWIVDVAGIIALTLPTVGIFITIAAGSTIDSDQHVAEILTRINYGIWFIWTAGIGTAVLLAGIRLVRILRIHHRKLRQGSTDDAVRAGIFKIQVAIAAFTLCLYFFSFVLLLYGILRDLIMENTTGSIVLGAGWSLTAGITVLVVQISIIFSRNTTRNAALRSKKSTDESTDIDSSSGNSTRPDHEAGVGISTLGAVSTTFQNDNEAIMNALQTNYPQEQNYCLPASKKPNSSKYFRFGRKNTKRPISTTSSQMELSRYSD